MALSLVLWGRVGACDGVKIEEGRCALLLYASLFLAALAFPHRQYHVIPFSRLISHVGLDKLLDRSHFEEEVWSYFAMGVQLQELYLSPDRMTSWAYDVIAVAAAWARRRAESLQRTTWVGGNAVELEAYGFASWSEDSHDCHFMLRNPRAVVQRVTLTLAAALRLPSRLTKTGVQPWAARLQCRFVMLYATARAYRSKLFRNRWLIIFTPPLPSSGMAARAAVSMASCPRLTRESTVRPTPKKVRATKKLGLTTEPRSLHSNTQHMFLPITESCVIPVQDTVIFTLDALKVILFDGRLNN